MKENYKTFLDYLFSEEGQNYLKEILLKQKEEKLQQEKETINKIFDSSYIEWLDIFTRKYNHFDGYIGSYYNMNISNEDLKNVKNFDVFFNFVEENVDPMHNKGIESIISKFYIKNKDIGYEIIKVLYEHPLFYCRRVDQNIKDYIDFNKIKTSAIVSMNKIDSKQKIKKK